MRDNNQLQRPTMSWRYLLVVGVVSFVLLICGVVLAFILGLGGWSLSKYSGFFSGALVGALVGSLQWKLIQPRLRWPKWMILQHVVGWNCWWGLTFDIMIDCFSLAPFCGLFDELFNEVLQPIWGTASSYDRARSLLSLQGDVVVALLVISQVIIPSLTMFWLMRAPINPPRSSVSTA